MHPDLPSPLPAMPLPRRAWTALVTACQDTRGRRLPWLATAFGSGVGVYFALPQEPSVMQATGLALLCALALLAAWASRHGPGLLPLLAAALLGGVLTGMMRTSHVAGPVLDWRYYGAVEGRVVVIDRSASEVPRITLDRVRLDGLAPDETPRRVRVSLHEATGSDGIRPGERVMTTAHLSAPNGPAEPGGFDFQRHAWFLELGALGYARAPLLRIAAPEAGAALLIDRWRATIATGLRDRMPGARGEVAAAITTGDRSGIPADVTEALRASNLAHLLAISGLHMGLLVGFVFWAVRGGLALWPAVALRYPTRAWAAASALPFALFYLFLSGGSVATQRAFVMAAVMLGAILLGRRALSLRSVALAALIVLAWRPESLTGPGFQMSFAATGALVLAFGLLTRARGRLGGWTTGWRGAVLALFLSSVVAGVATAPFSALHFNRVGQFGVLANMMAVPMMGTLVMPLLLVALLLWPLGLEAAPLWLAGQGIAWIIWVAEWVAGLPGSVGHIRAPGPWVLPLLGLGFAVIGSSAKRGTWRGKAAGAVLLVAAGGVWWQSPRPDLLIAGDGRLVGTMTAAGRHLSRDEGADFTAGVWLENDGDGVPQTEAAARTGGVDGLPEVVVLRGKTGLDAGLAACRDRGAWLVTPVTVEASASGCRVFDEQSLRATGAVSVQVVDGEIRVVTAAEVQGLRPWTAAYRERLAAWE